MKIHHLRNATFVIESKENFIIIDPMLGGKGTLPPFSLIKHKAMKNPTVSLPKNSSAILEKVNHCLITHSQTFGLRAFQHRDHLDDAGEKLLIENRIPVIARAGDEKYLKKLGMNVVAGQEHWQTTEFCGGSITAIPAKHGHGIVHKLMANGVGYILELPDEPSIYVAGDTVLTADVKKALHDFKPDIAVVAAGNAGLDLGGSILMPLEEVKDFVRLAPGKVIANHMDALNHCPVTRDVLERELEASALLADVYIPQDGETMHFERSK